MLYYHKRIILSSLLVNSFTLVVIIKPQDVFLDGHFITCALLSYLRLKSFGVATVKVREF